MPDNQNPAWQKLVEITRRLRAPEGCPWDREQTFESLRTHLLEEAYEVLEAIDSADRANLREELGDLLFQIVFLSQIASEEGCFDIETVCAGIADKLERRHPHVFGEGRLQTSGEVLRQWEELKDAERRQEEGSPGALSGVPVHLPALLKAHRLTAKASQFGLDWKGAAEVLEKLDEELEEFLAAHRQEGASDALEEELGDLLFTLANLGRHLSIDPEAALQRANRKFIGRFEHVERRLREQGKEWGALSAQELDRLWRDAKAEL
jgi:MazG family protein